MRYTVLLFTFSIFFGCGSTGSLNNELNVKVPFSTKNIFPLLKILRKYELIERDYYSYKGKKRGERIEDKKRDINYIKSLRKRFDEWDSSWEASINSNGKIITEDEWKIVNRALDEVFEGKNNVKSLKALTNNSDPQGNIDSLVNDFNWVQNYSNNF